MTIEQIVQCSADELEAMTDEQLLAHFHEMLNVTRPERVSAVVRKQEQQMTPKLKMGMELLKNLGVDVSGAMAPIKKGRR